MADQVLAFLRRLMNWHAARSATFRSPLVAGLARTRPSQQRRQRVLSDGELRAIWRATEVSPSAFGYLVRFLLLSAVRRNEAARMQRSEISGEQWTIPQERYKTGLELVIPLSAAARTVLEAVPKIGNSGFVFTTDGKRPIRGFSKFKRDFDTKVLAALRERDGEATLPRWTLHDLRRTARTLMSRAGIASDIAERALGHVLPNIRGTYDRHAPFVEKQDAFQRLGGLVEHIINPAANVVMFPPASHENELVSMRGG
jgi:integrase